MASSTRSSGTPTAPNASQQLAIDAINDIPSMRASSTPLSIPQLHAICDLMREIPDPAGRRLPPSKPILVVTVKALQRVPTSVPSAWGKPTLADAIRTWAQAALNLPSRQDQSRLFLSLTQNPSRSQVAIATTTLAQNGPTPASSMNNAPAPAPLVTTARIHGAPLQPSTQFSPPQGSPPNAGAGTSLQVAPAGLATQTPATNALAATVLGTRSLPSTRGSDPAFANRVGALRSASAATRDNAPSTDVSAFEGIPNLFPPESRQHLPESSPRPNLSRISCTLRLARSLHLKTAVDHFCFPSRSSPPLDCDLR